MCIRASNPRMRAWRHVAAIAIALFAVARSPALSRTPGPSRIVIFFDIDTLRADRLGTYGYGQPPSPMLEDIRGRRRTR